MICGIIWADRILPKGAEVAIGYEELDIVTTSKTYKKSKDRRLSSKGNLIEWTLYYQD